MKFWAIINSILGLIIGDGVLGNNLKLDLPYLKFVMNLYFNISFYKIF